MAGKPKPDERPKRLPPGVQHGTATAYGKKFRCRCGPCRDWRRGVTSRTKARKRGDLPPYETGGRTHGTVSSYNAGCHCPECRTVATAARRKRPSRLHTDRPISCPECPASFDTERGLRSHIGQIHDKAGATR